LIPATGFYEWKKNDKTKTPYHIYIDGADMFAFAGIWDSCKNSNGQVIHTFSIITTEPNELVKQVHDRMPAILNKAHEEDWLDEAADKEYLHSMLQPYNSELLKMYPVSSLTNSPKNNYKELLLSVEQELTPKLF
jgi:putative SOS response-associated peptidase YedK